MPMETDEKIKEILRTLVSFDVETDLQDEEVREEFVKYFGELVNTESDVSKNFLSTLIDNMGNILVDMNLIEPEEVETPAEEPTEEEPAEGGEEDLTGLGEEEPEEEVAKEGLDMTKLRSIADRANDFLME